MLCRITWRLLVILAVTVLFTTLTANAQNCVVPCVAQGSDYLQTGPGTFFDFTNTPTGFGPVQFTGSPNLVVGGQKQCCVDTIIQRQEDASLNDGPIPIQMVDLSLMSANPKGELNKNGFHYMVVLLLDPAQLPQDTGVMTINGDLTGGTFTSDFQGICFQATFMTTDGGPAINPFMNCVPNGLGALELKGAGTWGPKPPPGAFLVTAPYPAQQANEHTGLPAGYADFFISPQIIERHPNVLGNHVASPACLSQPTVFVPPNIAWWVCHSDSLSDSFGFTRWDGPLMSSGTVELFTDFGSTRQVTWHIGQ